MYTLFFKRLIDFCLSLLGFLILSPIFLMVMIWLFFSNNGKPFFLQQRPGKDEKIFSIIKFKSMNDKKDKDGMLLPYENRITKVGAFIRKYSLDEIPQLINVLKGDMSLVGPRPLLIEYLPLYNEEQKKRHHVKPGITGWAQVNGRNTISWKKKFELDTWYVNHMSFFLDIKIILLTVKRVVKKEGVNNSENLNMPMFTGNN
ncbi:lipopolysaccharide/colanic/teichoic acid biosynthesis glycosyltransferase [Mariniflexile fucanivorans]|uniref:Lipopolysaccharide/colanic/teichoic acid biosynthesis glycosyltransferase n=1 Tax=Mariniflexile fucanivorans TaxID=264023 RepID=A0A4R1RGA7_9FLAO|nr:sugar transferase [Mariniflexile fucanivorans]TCL65024.1 lipopolysaccharide/colanic/teichoic acid biosynthesis glycosyltransferase [Mariniflexile fucanivorans]